MLRITRLLQDGADLLRIEGDLRDGWLDEVRAVLAASNCGAAPPRLDLGDVTFADDAGIALLRELRTGGAEIVRCSGFLEALLGR